MAHSKQNKKKKDRVETKEERAQRLKEQAEAREVSLFNTTSVGFYRFYWSSSMFAV